MAFISTPMMRATLLALALPALCAVSGAARAQSASSYQQSCTQIGVAGSTLFANCRRIDGSFNRTSIAIPGIANINGVLQFQGPGEASSFQNSCSQIGVAGSTLFASCRRINGSFNQTSILIPGIANINGVLQYQ
jgi:hypothetical protein